MKSRIVTFVIGSATAVLLAGCAQIPQQTLHEAEKSLEEARKAGAELYAFSQFKAAQVSLELAKKEISEENRKLPFVRKYKKISETLSSAVRAAKSAQAAVEVAKTQIRNETEAIISQAELLADTVRTMLKKIPEKNIGTLPAELDSVAAAITSADKSLGEGNLLAAKEKAAVAQLKIAALAKSAQKLIPPRTSRSRVKKKR
jgi:hypothetical protein